MKTIKTSRQFRGSPISIRALCGLEGRSLPFSVLDIVTNDGVRHFHGEISTGDVGCTWAMTVWQNGFWSVKGDFHDDGILAGDFFYAEFLLDQDHHVGARLEGSILEIYDNERLLSLSKNGSDRWIRENWHRFESSGPTVRLHATPAFGVYIVAGFIALAIAGGYIFGGSSAERCDEAGEHPGGPACIHVQLVDAPGQENDFQN